MNTRYILENAQGETMMCVLAPEDVQTQWETVFAVRRGQGYGVDVTPTRVAVVDVFHADTVATFRIVSVTDTTDAVQLTLLPCEKKK